MIDIPGYFRKKERLKRIAAHYNEETPTYQAVLGDVINASRPESLDELLVYLMRESGMKDGMKVLDGGCGVCGPAIYFASHLKVDVTAITVSEVQFEIAKTKIATAPLLGSVTVIKGDYNDAGELFAPGSFDLIYFLEAFCYAEKPAQLFKELFSLLKPGGILYMKDLFLVDDLKKENKELYERIVGKINQFYATNLTYENNDINSFSKILNQSPFKVEFIRKPLYKTDNYSLYKAYQGMNDLGSDEAADIVRVIDFYEAKAVRPL